MSDCCRSPALIDAGRSGTCRMDVLLSEVERLWAGYAGPSVLPGSRSMSSDAQQDTAGLHVPVHPVRIVTAAALFDGHDAAINIMRRLLQAQGAEVIHLGHDRGVDEVVTAAIQ
ncbi:hypothetical protein, partial [Frankia sp. AvcI1]